jgi:hypothetical protein
VEEEEGGVEGEARLEKESGERESVEVRESE